MKNIFNNLLWGIYAIVYDVIILSIPHKRMMTEALNSLKIQKDSKIIDIGSGTGNFEYFLKEKEYKSITCVDISTMMLFISKLKFKFWKLKNYILYRRDITSGLNFDDQSFDKIICINTLYVVPKIKLFFQELNRITKTGGIVVMIWPVEDFKILPIVNGHVRYLWLQDKFNSRLKLIFQIIIYSIPFIVLLIVNMIIYFLLGRDVYRYHIPLKVSSCLRDCGFKVIKQDTLCERQEHFIAAIKK